MFPLTHLKTLSVENRYCGPNTNLMVMFNVIKPALLPRDFTNALALTTLILLALL